MQLPDASFDCGLLHDASPCTSRAFQDLLLAEAHRVLKPGGSTGSDSTPSFRWRLFHLFDTAFRWTRRRSPRAWRRPDFAMLR
jgi:ubiquinone/menaquinone biosynthesis C-methylase UbiE